MKKQDLAVREVMALKKIKDHMGDPEKAVEWLEKVIDWHIEYESQDPDTEGVKINKAQGPF